MIKVQHINKYFGEVHALNNIHFHVPKASICGFIGPNGAGKTTTMRILTTLDSSDSGDAWINGYHIFHDAYQVRREIGYMPDYYGTYPAITVAEYLDFFARAYKLKTPYRQQRIQKVSNFTELTGLLKRPVEGLSKGQKQRLSLTRILLPNPSVLLLDEPAAGLDPRARIELRELLKLLVKEGKSIFISSHILTELADLIDHVVIIHQGAIAYSGLLNQLSLNQHTQGHAYTLEVADENTPIRRLLLEHPAIQEVSGDQQFIHFYFDTQQYRIEELIQHIVEKGIPLCQIFRRKDHLEDIFMAVTDKNE